jgi:hypothetical protein
MCQELAQRFVNLSGCGFASQTVAKLGLDHREAVFDVRPLVIERILRGANRRMSRTDP